MRGGEKRGEAEEEEKEDPTHLEVDILHVLYIKAYSTSGCGEVAIQLPPIVLYAAIGEAEPWVYLTSSGSNHSSLYVVVVFIVGEVVQDVAIWRKHKEQVKNKWGVMREWHG